MRNKTGLSVAAIVTLALTPVHAQGRGGAHVPQNTTHVPSNPSPHPSTHGPSTHRPTTTSTGTSTSSKPGTSTTATSSPTTSGSTTTNPIATKIQSHPQLAARVTNMLPAGMTIDQASSGFRNQGQFIAALHVSQNLGIKFTDLKNTMLGTTTSGTTGATSGTTTTSTGPMSLGQAIHKLRPSVDSQSATTQATTQANGDLNGK